MTFTIGGAAVAADWVERPYHPAVGSRWIIQRDLYKEETRHENGRDSVEKRTIKITSELTIDAKTADGYCITYRRMKFSYDGDYERAAMINALTALNDVTIHAVTDTSGQPLRVENLDDIKNGLQKMIDKVVSSGKDIDVAFANRRVLAGVTRIDAAQAAEQYLDELPAQALAQNTGLKIGETRRGVVSVPNGIGPPLVKNTTLSIAGADASTGKLRLLLTESYDHESMRHFLAAVRKNAGGGSPDDMNKMDISLEDRTDIDVVDGMTRALRRESTASSNFFGNTMVTKDRKEVTVAPAP